MIQCILTNRSPDRQFSPKKLFAAQPATGAARTRIVAAMFSAFLGVHAVAAQSIATVDVPLTAINGRAPDSCRYSSVRRYPANLVSTVAAKKDTIILRIFGTSAFTDSAKSPVELTVAIANDSVGVVTPGHYRDTVFVAGYRLADRVVSVSAPNSLKALCAEVPLPAHRASNIDPTQSHIDFAASGEVANALNTGGSSAATTGSLGAHIVSFADPGLDTTAFFPFVPALLWPIDKLVGLFLDSADAASWHRRLQWRGPSIGLAEVQAFISVASSRDSLTGPAGGTFAQAVLSPITASRALASSVQLGYSPMHVYGARNQEFGIVGRLVVNQSTWRPDSTAVSKQTVLMAFDARLRWLPINHLSTDGNTFALTLDAGYIQRSILSDASRDAEFMRRALTSSRTRFTGFASSVAITLRHVTAFADLSCLSCNVLLLKSRHQGSDRIDQLEGFQPIVGFRFEAPFFSIQGK